MKKIILVIFIFLLVIGGFYFFKNKNLNLKKITQVLENKKNSFLNKENNLPKENSQDIYQQVSQGLSLEIFEPQNNITVNNPNLKIRGKTNPNIEVFINEKELRSDEKGEFQTDLVLDEGENIITIVVSDKQGNYAEKEIIVNFETLN